MNFRVEYENFEKKYLSKYATLSANSKGRKVEENQCEIRTVFQRDRDRILHSKSFRRLKHKTQVFLSPERDHYRTRLTHTIEVSQISRTVARALKLNEDLTEAIALGHDLGHTPFGHCGEEELNEIHKPDGFRHNEQSLRIVDYLEKVNVNYDGLNLTHEVRDGILNHNGDIDPYTLEGKIVKICDRIAYVNHDIDDAIRAKVLNADDIPMDIKNALGDSHSQRINTMIKDIIENSYGKNEILMSDYVNRYLNELRDFMFENVYLNVNTKSEEGKAKHIINKLYFYFLENPDKLPDNKYGRDNKGNNYEKVKDYIAGMTDRYAVNTYIKLFIPEFWK